MILSFVTASVLSDAVKSVSMFNFSYYEYRDKYAALCKSFLGAFKCHLLRHAFHVASRVTSDRDIGHEN